MKNAFGGSLLKHKRKSKRPLSHQQSTHLVLRLNPLLPPLFEPHDHDLRKLFISTANKYKIRVYDLILNHSHAHAVMLLPSREAYTSFIREVTSSITLHFSKNLYFLGAKLKRVFTHRPFTRFVHWGKAFMTLNEYMKKNELESGAPQRLWNIRFEEMIRGKSSNSAQLLLAGLAPP